MRFLDLSDEAPTYEMTFDDQIAFCNGDVLKASIFHRADTERRIAAYETLESEFDWRVLPCGYRMLDILGTRTLAKLKALPDLLNLSALSIYKDFCKQELEEHDQHETDACSGLSQ